MTRLQGTNPVGNGAAWGWSGRQENNLGDTRVVWLQYQVTGLQNQLQQMQAMHNHAMSQKAVLARDRDQLVQEKNQMRCRAEEAIEAAAKSERVSVVRLNQVRNARKRETETLQKLKHAKDEAYCFKEQANEAREREQATLQELTMTRELLKQVESRSIASSPGSVTMVSEETAHQAESKTPFTCQNQCAHAPSQNEDLSDRSRTRKRKRLDPPGSYFSSDPIFA